MTKDCLQGIGNKEPPFKTCPFRAKEFLMGSNCNRGACALWDEVSKVCCLLSLAVDFGIIRALMEMEGGRVGG